MKRRFGFTLIELLVVVAIIGLLIAILLPSLSKAKKQATTAKCLANVRGMGTGITYYVADYKVMFGYGTGGDFWVPQLNRYVDLNKLRVCPDGNRIPGATGAGGVNEAWYGSYAGTDPKTGQPFTGSYALNGWLQAFATSQAYMNQEGVGGTADKSWFWNFPIRRNESQAPVFVDSVWYDGWPHTRSAVISNTSSPAAPATVNPSHMGRFQLNRHIMKVGVSFLDGHAEAVPLKQLWAQRWHQRWGDGTINEPVQIPASVPK